MYRTCFQALGNFSGWPGQSLTNLGAVSMDLDMAETEKNYQVHADLPGVDKSNITVSLANNTLCICAEKKKDETFSDENWRTRERYVGRIRRSIPLPANADEANITSKYQNGVLYLEIPKAPSDRDLIKNIEVQ